MINTVLIAIMAIGFSLYIYAIVLAIRKDIRHKEKLKEEKRKRREMLYK